MTPETLIRVARPDDADTIAAFNIAMAQETEAKALDPAIILPGVRALFERPQLGFYLVAEREGQVAGTLMVTTEWSDWRNGVFWWIQSVYVAPEHRRQGLYRAMYRAVQARAAEAGDVCGFRLYVEKDNVAAQRTYRSLGMGETDYKVYEQLT